MLNVIKSNLSPSMFGSKVNSSRLLLVLILAPIFSFTGIAASSAAIIASNPVISKMDGIEINSFGYNEPPGIPNSAPGYIFRMTAPTPPGNKVYGFYSYPQTDTDYKNVERYQWHADTELDNVLLRNLVPNNSYVAGFQYPDIAIFLIEKLDANTYCADLNTCSHELVATIGNPPTSLNSTSDPDDVVVDAFTEKVSYDYYRDGVLIQSRVGPKGGPVLPYTGSGTVDNTCIKKYNDFTNYITIIGQTCSTPLVPTPDELDKGLDPDGSCGFSLTNPTSWVKCIFVPTDLNTPVQKMKKSFDSTFLGTATGVVSDLFSPFKLWVSSQKPACQGYGVTLPVHLFGQGRADMLVYPMSTCAPIVQQYLPYVLNIMSSFLYLGTLFVLLRILFGAFGLKFDLFRNGE
jgi:hypothetical protein